MQTLKDLNSAEGLCEAVIVAASVPRIRSLYARGIYIFQQIGLILIFFNIWKSTTNIGLQANGNAG